MNSYWMEKQTRSTDQKQRFVVKVSNSLLFLLTANRKRRSGRRAGLYQSIRSFRSCAHPSPAYAFQYLCEIGNCQLSSAIVSMGSPCLTKVIYTSPARREATVELPNAVRNRIVYLNSHATKATADFRAIAERMKRTRLHQSRISFPPIYWSRLRLSTPKLPPFCMVNELGSPTTTLYSRFSTKLADSTQACFEKFLSSNGAPEELIAA